MVGILVPAVAGLAVLLLFFGLSRASAGGEESVTSRLEDYARRDGQDELAPSGGGRGARIAESLNTLLSKRRGASNMTARLARADLKMKPPEFLLLTAGTTLVAFLLLLVIKRDLFLAVLAGLGGYYLPHFWLKRRMGKRVHAFSGQLGDTITLLSNSLRSGYSLLQAMDTVARELSPPMSTEFSRVVKEIGLGLSVQHAMGNMYRRVPSEDLDLMITAVNVQHEVGGNLAEILETIGHTIRERIRIQGEIRVLTTQQRGTGFIIGSLPFGITLFLYLINKKYIMTLFTDPCGWAMIALVFILLGSGAMVIRKIIQIDV
jgi:tight adherence protein B